MDACITYLTPYAQQATGARFNKRVEFIYASEVLVDLVAAAEKLNADGHRVLIVSYYGRLWADCLAPTGTTAGWYGSHHTIHAQPASRTAA